MAYSIDSIQDGCYPGTSVLVNKFGYTTAEQLDDAESLITWTQMVKLEESPLAGDFDFIHYKAIHKFLFDELYDWAGTIRTIDLYKRGTKFCPAAEIEQRAHSIFDRLKQKAFFRSLSQKQFIEEIVDFYCTTNELHPFREGNGRTQRSFLTQLIRLSGRDFNFSDIDEELLMIATIHSAQGTNDQLIELFTHAIQ